MWQYNMNYLQHEDWKKHKYLDKYLKNGKWIYDYGDEYNDQQSTSGATSTKKKQVTLTEQGRALAKNVKADIKADRDAQLTEEQERYRYEQKIRSDAASRTMEQHRLIMNQRITSIQNLIKRMSPERKAAELPKLKSIIVKLREDNDKKRESIRSKYKAEGALASMKTKETKTNIREEAKAIYESEYDKIAANFSKPKKKK